MKKIAMAALASAFLTACGGAGTVDPPAAQQPDLSLSTICVVVETQNSCDQGLTTGQQGKFSVIVKNNGTAISAAGQLVFAAGDGTIINSNQLIQALPAIEPGAIKELQIQFGTLKAGKVTTTVTADSAGDKDVSNNNISFQLTVTDPPVALKPDLQVSFKDCSVDVGSTKLPCNDAEVGDTGTAVFVVKNVGKGTAANVVVFPEATGATEVSAATETTKFQALDPGEEELVSVPFTVEQSGNAKILVWTSTEGDNNAANNSASTSFITQEPALTAECVVYNTGSPCNGELQKGQAVDIFITPRAGVSGEVVMGWDPSLWYAAAISNGGSYSGGRFIWPSGSPTIKGQLLSKLVGDTVISYQLEGSPRVYTLPITIK